MYEGMLVRVKPKDRDTGIMPWESLEVEWDDEADANTVNPWEVEASPSPRGVVGALFVLLPVGSTFTSMACMWRVVREPSAIASRSCMWEVLACGGQFLKHNVVCMA